MKKLLLALFLLPAVAFAQAPDDETIITAITDGTSPYYYPQLFSRYIDGDTTLTQTDYHYLYYGFPHQEAYKPLEPAPSETAHILMIFEHSPVPNRQESEEIIRLATDAMREIPFDPSNLNFLTYAYGVLGDTLNERINHDRFTKIIKTIKSSGTGLKEESPWHVIYFSHVNDVLGTMGVSIRKRMIVTRTSEFVALTKRQDNGVRGYYFDFSRIYWTRPETRENRVRGLQINGLDTGRKQ